MMSSQVKMASSAALKESRRGHLAASSSLRKDARERSRLCLRCRADRAPGAFLSAARKGPWRSVSSATEPAMEASVAMSSFLISPGLKLGRNPPGVGKSCASCASRASPARCSVEADCLGGVSDVWTPSLTSASGSASASFLNPLMYSSGLFFHVNARPTMAGLDSAADDWAKLEMLGLLYPVAGVSSLDGRLAWPLSPPPTASRKRPKPERASLTLPATLLKTVLRRASLSPGLSEMLVADPGGGAE